MRRNSLSEGTLNMTVLSIVVPVYNVEKYLRQCLDSVIGAKTDAYEIVCVNDGSTDSSPAILEEYREKYPETVRVVHTENGGLGAASNNGIKAAKGAYIAFLDSDDTFREHAVEEMVEACGYGDDMIIFDFADVTEDGQMICEKRGCSGREEGVFTLEEYPQLLFERANRWNKLYRRTLFEEADVWYPGRVWFEDYWTNPKLYPKCKSIRYVRKTWYNYRQQPASITHNRNVKKNLDIIDAAESVVSFYEKEGLFEQYRDELEYSVFYNVLLTSTDRVNLIDPKSDVQIKLLEYTQKRFPEYEKNRYVQEIGRKYQLLHSLIKGKRYALLHAVLKANEWTRKK